ncbi:MAG: biopolymer transporter ExbD [Desulfohalobiaceae bacterium]|nr:biopolymer transporter ExbD [Desulfohalobiaceae bacterium]
MSALERIRGRRGGGTDINMAPLIDMIFILLIFFLVTTSFVQESGVTVERPSAESAVAPEKTNLIIGIDEHGRVHIRNEEVDIRAVRSRMEEFSETNPKGSVVIAADKKSTTDTLIRVLDACRLADVSNISVAARKPQ